ncbi:protein CutA homolog isoform X1 [Centruroides sculpturatus]|uniref:protein CutA homolog isoform X1 n=2 Tax=Centruroides sculpturatus TaxID=218467 RepID=UPI000C6D461B|nr:protein CutA homolog isoform X1 [Centruroides sculpturatus]XP_023222907.1 protein CutA homolog isoform X1 [Centruroides sculpturatus]XP_023222908.1 protein CutA homolog isoform X1 [Centruroides sculpturatus]
MILRRYLGIILIIPVCLFMPNLFRFARHFSTMASNASSYVPGTHSIAYVTVPNDEVAKKLADGLVSKKLAACVNVIPNIYSVYEWKNEIQKDPELLLMIKTRSSRLEELTTYVRENHPYEVCEVISVPIQQGNLPYLQWIGDIVPEKSS